MPNQSKDSFEPKSSFIMAVEYDKNSRTMMLTFKSGSQYMYQNVFESTWLSFKESKDHSSYYSNAIKGRVPGVPILSKAIGRKPSSPLKQNKMNRSLNKPNGNITTAGISRNLKRSGLIPKDFGR